MPSDSAMPPSTPISCPREVASGIGHSTSISNAFIDQNISQMLVKGLSFNCKCVCIICTYTEISHKYDTKRLTAAAAAAAVFFFASRNIRVHTEEKKKKGGEKTKKGWGRRENTDRRTSLERHELSQAEAVEEP